MQDGQIRDCNNRQLGPARSCNDGSACNDNEGCVNNRCQAVSGPLCCNDGNACTDDSCSPASGMGRAPTLCGHVASAAALSMPFAPQQPSTPSAGPKPNRYMLAMCQAVPKAAA